MHHVVFLHRSLCSHIKWPELINLPWKQRESSNPFYVFTIFRTLQTSVFPWNFNVTMNRSGNLSESCLNFHCLHVIFLLFLLERSPMQNIAERGINIIEIILIRIFTLIQQNNKTSFLKDSSNVLNLFFILFNPKNCYLHRPNKNYFSSRRIRCKQIFNPSLFPKLQIFIFKH